MGYLIRVILINVTDRYAFSKTDFNGGAPQKIGSLKKCARVNLESTQNLSRVKSDRRWWSHCNFIWNVLHFSISLTVYIPHLSASETCAGMQQLFNVQRILKKNVGGFRSVGTRTFASFVKPYVIIFYGGKNEKIVLTPSKSASHVMLQIKSSTATLKKKGKHNTNTLWSETTFTQQTDHCRGCRQRIRKTGGKVNVDNPGLNRWIKIMGALARDGGKLSFLSFARDNFYILKRCDNVKEADE